MSTPTFTKSDPQSIPSIVKALRDSYNTHITQSLAWRVEQLQLLHKILSDPQHREEICHAMYLDLGRSRAESLSCEVDIALTEVIHFIQELRSPSFGMEKVSTNLLNAPATSYVRNDPYGVVLVSSPWNYPTLLCLQPLAGALAAGNTVLLRPGTYSKNTSECLYKLITTYFNPAFVNIVVGERDITHGVLQEKFDLVFFTGGPTLGKLYHKAAAETFTPTVLELGGSNPTIVWKDANITTAARRLTWGCFLNAGQTCVRPQNLFVHKDVAQDFVAAVKKTISEFYTFGNDHTEFRTKATFKAAQEDADGKLKSSTIHDFVRQQDHLTAQIAQNNIGKTLGSAEYQSTADAIKKSPYFGRVITNDAFARLKAIIEKDQQFIVAGGEHDASERFIAPTVMVFNDMRDFKNSAAVSGGEIFGPIIPILIVDDLDTVFDFINAGDKPLSLYAFTNDAKIRERVLQQTSSGSLMFNDCLMQLTNSALPFGGVGLSGMGGYHGKWSLQTFSHQKSVMYKSDFGPADLPVRYPPYTTTGQAVVNAVVAAERNNVLGYLTIPIIALTGYGLYRVAPSALPYAIAGLAVAKNFCDSGMTLLQGYCSKQNEPQAKL